MFFTPREKLRLAMEMEGIGIKRAEVGFPIVTEEEFRRLVRWALGRANKNA